MKYVTINLDLLGQAVLDYFEDIDRLKKYEDIERINVDKIYAYELYWFIKRKPIQIVTDEINIKYLHINEKIFLTLMIDKMLKEMGITYDDVNERFETFLDLLFYNLKYRLYTQKSLELMISAFFCGCSFRKSI